MSSTTTAVNGGTIHSNLPLQYEALTSVPTYQAVVVHPMSRKFVCNEPQIPLGIQCSVILPVSNEKEGPSALNTCGAVWYMVFMVVYVRVVHPSTIYVAIIQGAPTKPKTAVFPPTYTKE